MGTKMNEILLVFLSVLVLIFQPAQGGVPAKSTFSYVNEGDLGEYIVEYGANYRPLPVASEGMAIFQLIFFNTTPNAYALAVRMGNHNNAETMRFVWTANRNDLVKDNATLKFGRDGNLVLSDADGRPVWSTGTPNRGVVGLKLRNDGNLVLYAKKNRTVWQSFDHPTDSLLVGQSLNARGVKKLVSRASDEDGSEGPYSLVLEAGGLAMYAGFPKPLPYWTLSYYNGRKDLFAVTHACERPLSSLTFLSDPRPENGFRQEMEMRLANQTAPPDVVAAELCDLTSNGSWTALYAFSTPRFNTNLSFVRLDSDGNLRMYTYSPDIELNTWDITYQRFGCGAPDGYSCGPPRKCGSLGLCRDGQCVACPEADGLKGWSVDTCSPPKLPNCTDHDHNNNNSIDFLELGGVEHFSNKYVAGEVGKLGLEECKERCVNDCSCAAFFYWRESSKCFLTQSLDTLQQLSNPQHLAFIKIPKRA